MTADDFFLLFTAFGGFVIAPALLLWGIALLTRGKQDATRGPDIRPDARSPDTSADDRRKEAAPQSWQANDFLHRIGRRQGMRAPWAAALGA